MPLFTVIGLDHPPHSMVRRDAARSDHRTYVKQNDEKIRLACAMLDADENQCGSLYIFEADDEQQVRDWLAEEPFVNGEVYKEIIIRRVHLAHNVADRVDWRSA